MSIDSVASLGTLGIQRGLQGLRESATQVAGSATGASDAKDTAAALVALKQHEQQVAASAKVVETADGVIGALLDTFA